MNEYFKEKIREQLDEGVDRENISQELYDHEMNFNNADPTSGMRCYDVTEIEMMIQEVKDERKK